MIEAGFIKVMMAALFFAKNKDFCAVELGKVKPVIYSPNALTDGDGSYRIVTLSEGVSRFRGNFENNFCSRIFQ